MIALVPALRIEIGGFVGSAEGHCQPIAVDVRRDRHPRQSGGAVHWSGPPEPVDNKHIMVRRTFRQIGQWLEEADAGGWALLVAGLMLFAVTALTPTLVKLTTIQQRRAELAAHRHRIEAKCNRTERMVQLVEAGDPLLLQRLGWRELRLQPASAVFGQPIGRVLEPRSPALGDLPSPSPSTGPGHSSALAEATLLRWTQGRSRQVMLVGSVVLIGLGLLSSFRRRPDAAAGR